MSLQLVRRCRKALTGKLALPVLAAGLILASGGGALAAETHVPSLNSILSHTPVWVWPLILYGLFIGWNRTRARIVAPRRLFVMPALITGLALYNLASSGISVSGLLGFACGAVAGALTGIAVARRRPAKMLADGRLALQGDWVPLVLIVAIIVIRYAKGVALGVDPALAEIPSFILASAFLSGFFAAMMIARTVGVLPSGFFRNEARKSDGVANPL
ncbi:hypothetical protein LGH82_18300 [Mesorhizobium sp. PAMC28654]|uniref:DUF6622 family protein n=1 Tax=Mesorhizobium sp. PAMC28654 TaxID=2880934 RepID=UPI001D0B5C35|nr:DUF6622 family protein [Mesorhizobium sp. PAMC28654]UDL87154.1 hypothetical protein LGH82_18300 [Mesorhizobium sp. PAMC28654]